MEYRVAIVGDEKLPPLSSEYSTPIKMSSIQTRKITSPKHGILNFRRASNLSW